MNTNRTFRISGLAIVGRALTAVIFSAVCLTLPLVPAMPGVFAASF